MDAVTRVWKKLRIYLGRTSFSRDLEEEMAYHQEEAERAFVAEGIDAGRRAPRGEAAVWKRDEVEGAEPRNSWVLVRRGGPGFSVCGAAVAEEPWIRDYGDSDAGAGHWSQCGDLRICGCGTDPAIAVCQS